MPKPVLIYEDIETLAQAFIEKFHETVLNLSMDHAKINIGLSGGNTPKTIFKKIAESHKDQFPWHQMHFFWGDERCVRADSDESNYGEAKRLLFDHIVIPEKNLHFIDGNNEPEKEWKRYEKELYNNLETRNNLPKLNINILGMGDDGHTASIFPSQSDLLACRPICAVAQHPLNGQKRITITGKTLNNADFTFMLISGNNKAQVLQEIINKTETASQYPAFHIAPTHGTLEYYIDKAAAALL